MENSADDLATKLGEKAEQLASQMEMLNKMTANLPKLVEQKNVIIGNQSCVAKVYDTGNIVIEINNRSIGESFFNEIFK